MKRAKQFYQDGLGFPIKKNYARFVSFDGGDGSSDLAMYQLDRAARVGGNIVKPGHAASWGGYRGYFADPDGYLWKVAA
jgi:hypothetical protein